MNATSQTTMPLPDYKRPFDTEDFRGYFKWSQALTDAVGGKLYHACHREELEDVLSNEELGLRSTWALRLPQHGLWNSPGVWTGLNYYVNGNKYGPFVIEFPLSILNGRRFMAFRRIGGRRRHFFVQYEATIPIYSFGKELWRGVNPKHYFEKAGVGAIWDIILTAPVTLHDISVSPVEHPSCIPGKCQGTSRSHNRRILREIARQDFGTVLRDSEVYAQFLARFPDAVGLRVALPDLESD